MDSTKPNFIGICSVALKIRHLNPLNAELNPICHFWHYQELTIFSTLAGLRLINTQTTDISNIYFSKNTLRNLSLCFIIRSNPGRCGEVYLSFITFRLTQRPNRSLIQWVQGSFRGVKAAGREGNHSPPSSIEFKNSKVIPVLSLEGLDRDICAIL